MTTSILDYAYLIDRTKDTALYQHCQSMQLFQTVIQANGSLEIFKFFDGVWESEGIAETDHQVSSIANP
jgi:hypothetical protein